MAPEADPSRSWPVVTGRLAVLASVGSLLVLLLPVPSPQGIAAVDGSILVLFLIDWLLAPAPKRITVTRHIPASLALGHAGELEWRIGNLTGRRTRIGIADELAPSLGPERRRFSTVLSAGEEVVATTSLLPVRRGDFRPTALTVRAAGPLGLAGRQATRRLPGHLRVVPSFRSRREAELRMDRSRLLEVGQRSARFRGGGSEFEQLRDYSVDDESRRIDWAATARSGHPIVRTYRAERNQQLLLLLDNGRLMAGQIGGAPRVEHAMDAAMAVTAVATRMGDRVGLMAFDLEVRAVVSPGSSADQLRRVVDGIYRLEPVLAESDYRRAFLELAVRQRRRSLVMLLTELADQALDDTLLADLPLLASRHLVVVGAAQDPAVESWASARPASAGEAYRQAAAAAALESRERLAARLSARGVDVVDAPPGHLAARLADYYLEAKATARL